MIMNKMYQSVHLSTFKKTIKKIRGGAADCDRHKSPKHYGNIINTLYGTVVMGYNFTKRPFHVGICVKERE